MSISYWLDQTQDKKETRTCDFLIVGAGIAGLSTAFWLERLHPQARVFIVDRHTLLSGASARNGGFITCGSVEHFARLREQHGGSLALQIWKFSEINRELMKEHIIQDGASDVQFLQNGSATVAWEQTQWERFQTTAHHMAQAGLDISELTPKDIQNKYNLKNYRGGIFYQKDGQVHPAYLLRRLRSRLRATVIENQEVFRFSEDGSLETQNYIFRPTHTFLTLNAYLPLLAPEFQKLITPQRGQVLVTRPISARVNGPVYITHRLAYLRQLQDGELLIGGFRHISGQTEETYADQTTDLVQHALQDYLQEHFGSIQVQYRWAGVMGFSPDGQMLIGRHPARASLSLMAGCSGHGMGLSFHAAKLLVESYDNKPVPAHLDLNRFRF